MKMRRVVEYVAAGMAVYMGMAACSAESGESRRAATGGGGGGDSGADASGASGGAGGSGVDGSLLDALTDPIPDAKADSNTSGSRLKANHYAGADGSRQFIGWHDSDRDEDCAFTKTSSGPRCLPATYITATNFFLDAGCSQPLWAVTQGLCEKPYLFESLPTTNCEANNYYPGNEVTKAYSMTELSLTNVYAVTGQTCDVRPAPAPASYRWFTKGAEVPLTDFAAATIMTD